MFMYFVIKRLIDLILAGAMLIVLAIPLLIIMLILRYTGEGEVFYQQQRFGFQNRPFGVWKFVTMRKDSEKTGTITVGGDPRVLPVGKFLRATKINELPQLWNVITGEMSLVGPRPLTTQAFDLYPDHYKPLVYQSKPGLTGIGSVVFRHEEQILAQSGKERLTCYREDIMPLKGALEAWYLENRSTSVDMKIMLLTAIAILRPGSQLHHRWLKNLPDAVTIESIAHDASRNAAHG
jgi:lipopolysaccharide/colanic/teichoic acid biosynthesis glycosyltransferase